MGSKGQKPRKPSHSQHLSKSHAAASSEQHLQQERQAMWDVMGMGNVSSGTKAVLTAIVVLLFIGAIVGLMALTIL